MEQGKLAFVMPRLRPVLRVETQSLVWLGVRRLSKRSLMSGDGIAARLEFLARVLARVGRP